MYWGAFGEANVGDASPVELGMLLSIPFFGISLIVSYLIYIPPALISFSYPYDHYKFTSNLPLCKIVSLYILLRMTRRFEYDLWLS